MSGILIPGGAKAPGGAAPSAAGPQVRCPRCQTPFTAQIVNVVDAQLAPQLKSALLSGYLNRVVCPSCGAMAALNVPLIYHDPEKELLLILLPSELNLSADQQQRLIGGLVQAIMANVPQEQRKGYFLRPQTILTMQHLVETILEADGVTPEMIEAQNQRFRLLEDLLRAANDPARLSTLLEENRARLDYSFFATLVSAAQEAEAVGDAQSADQLLALRDRLVQDPQVAARLPQPLPPDATVETALEKLLPLAEDEQALTAMVVLNRPFFDYLFFQGLTAQLEQAQKSGDSARAGKLAALRNALLDEIQQQDRALQAAQEQDLRLIDELVSSPDQQAAIRQHLPKLDTLFLSTLGAAIQAARREGNVERSARLDALRRAILDLLAQAMPPELRLVNRLLSLEKPEERQAVLAASAGLLNDNLVALVEELLRELSEQGRPESAQRLQDILSEIKRAQAAPSPTQAAGT